MRFAPPCSPIRPKGPNEKGAPTEADALSAILVKRAAPQFLRWEFEEEAWHKFLDDLVTEIAGRLYPGKGMFTHEEVDAIHAEVEKRRLEGWERERERRARFRVVRGEC
jgi:hypothetical protein